MPIVKEVENRHRKVIKSDIVDPGDKKYQLSPRGFWRTLKYYVVGQKVENLPTYDFDGRGYPVQRYEGMCLRRDS